MRARARGRARVRVRVSVQVKMGAWNPLASLCGGRKSMIQGEYVVDGVRYDTVHQHHRAGRCTGGHCAFSHPEPDPVRDALVTTTVPSGAGYVQRSSRLTWCRLLPSRHRAQAYSLVQHNPPSSTSTRSSTSCGSCRGSNARMGGMRRGEAPATVAVSSSSAVRVLGEAVQVVTSLHKAAHQCNLHSPPGIHQGLGFALLG